MRRVFLVLVAMLLAGLLSYPAEHENVSKVAINKQIEDIELTGNWLDNDKTIYEIYDVSVDFSQELSIDEKEYWAKLLQITLELLPKYIRVHFYGLEIYFSTVNMQYLCNTNIPVVLACFYIDNVIFIDADAHVMKDEVFAISTLLHEIGHAVEFNISPYEDFFIDLHNTEIAPTKYASQNEREDFAESFFIYVMYPSYLKKFSPERYAFMKNNIFSGLEYKDKFPVTPTLEYILFRI